MRKWICFSLISLVCGFLSAHAATQSDNTKPFVGKWEYWEDNCQIQLEIDQIGRASCRERVFRAV